MKRAGTELGNLAANVLAYAQLKGKEVVRTGELAPVLGITTPQERDLLRRLSRRGWIVRLQRGLYLVPQRIPAGGKYRPGVGIILEKLMDELKGRYQLGGPTAFNYYGFDDQIPSITYVYNNRISGRRRIGKPGFQFIKTGDGRLGAVKRVPTREGTEIIYASKSRTLMDSVYDWSRFNSLPRGYTWIKQEILKDPKIARDLAETTAEYGNQATIRRIGYLLERILDTTEYEDKLQGKLRSSKSLIPWIPDKPAKGATNRKWGVIANG
ncbi:type IV toxin-antitoxin system AbiEi family antitoxin domain-containing protein [Candidatus Neomarinimicrobiota bacterium]